MLFDSEQQEAVALVADTTNLVGVVTGAPGTGKTTCTVAALERLQQAGKTFALAAPTGKAAQRFAQVTGCEATTIHRLLEWMQGSFRRNQANPLPQDVILIDEASMIDLFLFADLISAIDATRTRLVLIGDPDQLPPVGPGQPFLDLIASGRVPVVRLQTLHRSAEGSWIYRNASRVIAGEGVELDDCVDFEWMQITPSEAHAIPDIAAEKLAELLDPMGDAWNRDDIQVMAPMKDKEGGVNPLNAALKKAFGTNRGHAAQISAAADTQTVHVGDRVIQTKNDYKLGVFNGEVGEVDDIMNASTIRVRFGAEYRTYKGAELRNLMLAYACTIHRCQGSEWPVAMVVCHSVHNYMLNRRLLYTALTRARKRIIVIGDDAGMKRALSTRVDMTRRTLLKNRLCGEL